MFGKSGFDALPCFVCEEHLTFIHSFVISLDICLHTYKLCSWLLNSVVPRSVAAAVGSTHSRQLVTRPDPDLLTAPYHCLLRRACSNRYAETTRLKDENVIVRNWTGLVLLSFCNIELISNVFQSVCSCVNLNFECSYRGHISIKKQCGAKPAI